MSYLFWLGASAEPTGLASAEAPEPGKLSRPSGSHPSRCTHKRMGKAPMDSTVWFCLDCNYRLDIADERQSPTEWR